MELFYQNIRKEGRRDGAVLSEHKEEGRRDGAVLSEQRGKGRQERWSCFIRTDGAGT